MQPVHKLYSSNERVFKMNMEGITHEESLKQMNHCNTLNWVVGHLVLSRNSVLAMLNLPAAPTEAMKEVYGRGVANPDMGKAMNIETLKSMYLDTQPLIMSALDKTSDEALLEKLAFSGMHEAYHMGQIGMLRKMLGKEGAIK
ncbi:MAG: hypothetical protein HKL88_09915 [Bacteroidia bacterium]|jgi:hypothetical protein|nr:hypothetical protein [Bacteroidia bacterium]